MTASGAYQERPDLLVDEAPVPAGRSRALTLLAAGAVAGGALVGAVQDDAVGRQDRAPVSMSGSMTVGGFSSRTVALRSGHEQDRDARGNGSIELHLPGRDLEGSVTVEFSAATLLTSDRRALAVHHSWGTVIASLGTNTCRGALGVSYVMQPAGSGGSVQLRCDDGTAFAAAIAVTQTGDSFDVALSDGWYFPAGRA